MSPVQDGRYEDRTAYMCGVSCVLASRIQRSVHD